MSKTSKVLLFVFFSSLAVSICLLIILIEQYEVLNILVFFSGLNITAALFLLIRKGKEMSDKIKVLVYGFSISLFAGIFYIIFHINQDDASFIPSFLLWLSLCTAIILVMMFSVVYLDDKYNKRVWAKNPEQKGTATLIDKGEHYIPDEPIQYYATFEFSDGTRGLFYCPSQTTFEFFNIGTSGVLYYKIIKGKYKFIKFIPSDEQLSDRTLSSNNSTDMIYNGTEAEAAIISAFTIPVYILIFLGLYYIPDETEHIERSVLILVSLLSLIGTTLFLIYTRKLETADSQIIEAEIVYKDRTDGFHITFSFAGGGEKRIPVHQEIHAVLIVGDTGVLTFKERKKRTMFISFERNINSNNRVSED